MRQSTKDYAALNGVIITICVASSEPYSHLFLLIIIEEIDHSNPVNITSSV